MPPELIPSFISCDVSKVLAGGSCPAESLECLKKDVPRNKHSN